MSQQEQPSSPSSSSSINIDVDVTPVDSVSQVACSSGTEKQPRSKVWEYFTKSDNYKTSQKVFCKHCPRTFACKFGATGNLWRHIRNDHRSPTEVQTGPLYRHLIRMSDQLKFNEQNFREALAKWIVLEAMPFSVVESSSFHNLLGTLNNVEIDLSARTLKRDVI